jgi:hypothetical protein
MSSVDMCRLNKFDNPDFVYGRHDGTIIKRLFSAFSFRPTVVSTLPIGQIFSYNPYFQNLRPLVTSIPMVNVRLLRTLDKNGQPKIANLSETLTQTQKFIEGNLYVERATTVMYSREVLVFFIDRRSSTYTLNTTPFNVLRMPSSVAGFEAVTTTKLDVPGNLTLTDGSSFVLRSAVVAETRPGLDKSNPNLTHVIGSSALVDTQVGSSSTLGNQWAKYEPHNAVRTGAPFAAAGLSGTEATELIETTGVILIYHNTKYEPSNLTVAMN